MAVDFTNTFHHWKIVPVICFGLLTASCAPENDRTTEDFLQQAETLAHSDKVAELNERLASYRADPTKTKELKAMAGCMAKHDPQIEPFRTSVCYDTEIERFDNPWSLSEDTSLMEDTKDVYLQTDSSSYLDKYDRNTRTTLMVRCRENTTSVIFLFDEYLGLDETKVQYRIDKQSPITKSMRISTNNTSAGLWNGNAAIPFAKALFDKTQLAVRVTPYGENPREMTFNISNLESEIQPLRDACGW